MFHIFELEFFGCRGSTPVAGAQFLRYGGNTTSIALYADNHLMIVDCGTGLFPLQSALFDTGRYQRADIFLTHMHWDHVQGIPFFTSFFLPTCSFTMYGEQREGRTLREQMDFAMVSPMFPITADALNAHIDYRDIQCGDTLRSGNVTVTTARLCHPNVCTGYRFTYEGKSVCIVGDYEHGSGCVPLEFARDADILVYDAQYTEAEYPKKKGWGHSTWEQGCEFANRCGAKRLYLTHHDPARTDDDLDALVPQARAVFPNANFAAEGSRIPV